VPRVSICIPTYNRAELVSGAIDSALAQSEQDIEVVLLDDASTDATPEIAAGYRDPRFRTERTERRRGISWGLNRCLELAKGTYVNVLCDDDRLYTGAVSQFADGLDRFPEATFATSAWNSVDADGSFLHTTRLLNHASADGTLVGLRQIVRSSWLCRNRIGPQSAVLIRKKSLAGLRFRSEYPQICDWELLLRLLMRGPLVYFPQVLSAYRLHDKSLTAAQRPMAQSASDLLTMSAELAGSLSELRGAVSRFDLKRLQLLCCLKASETALRNAVGGDPKMISQNLRVAKRALLLLVR